MPFPVRCGCGQAFMAEDWLAGQQVCCPACGQPLQIPAAPARPDVPPTPPAQPAARSYQPSARARTQTTVPASSGHGDAMDMPVKVAIGAAVGVVLVVLGLIVLQSLPSPDGEPLAGASAPSAAAETDANRKPLPSSANPPHLDPAAALAEFDGTRGRSDSTQSSSSSEQFRSDGPGRSSPVLPPIRIPQPPGADAARSTTSRPPTASLPLDPAPAETTSSQPAMPAAMERWFAESNGSLVGAEPIEDQDFVLFHNSWLCRLLPYLGHEDVYNEFDFRKSWSDEANLQLSGVVIPEFLNPADDRQRWTGLQFEKMALTHFVGMSGIEDRRTVVAATLPRSDPRAGVFGYDQIVRPEEIQDGASQTIMVIGAGEIVAPWVQGGGATIRGARQPYFDSLTGFGSRGLAEPGTAVLMADGSTRHLTADIDPAVFRALCTIGGGETVDTAPLGSEIGNFPGTVSSGKR